MVGSLRASRTASTLRGLQAQVQPVAEIVQCGELEALFWWVTGTIVGTVPEAWNSIRISRLTEELSAMKRPLKVDVSVRCDLSDDAHVDVEC